MLIKSAFSKTRPKSVKFGRTFASESHIFGNIEVEERTNRHDPQIWSSPANSTPAQIEVRSCRK